MTMIKKRENEVERLYNKTLRRLEKEMGTEVTYQNALTLKGRKMFGDAYVGTFGSDKIPHLKLDECCIVNLDRSSESGSHWVAVVGLKRHNLLYDSFGRPGSEILPSLRRSEDVDNDVEQAILEENCGPRCLAFLLCHYTLGYEYSKLL